jgi:putative transcriptional regulator
MLTIAETEIFSRSMTMTTKELKQRDSKRDLGAELLESVRQMKSGRAGKIHKVAISPVVSARMKSGLSQSEFAKLLGVSVRTLQDWEQGRREPSGAARTLIAIAEQRPEVLREVIA